MTRKQGGEAHVCVCVCGVGGGGCVRIAVCVS